MRLGELVALARPDASKRAQASRASARVSSEVASAIGLASRADRRQQRDDRRADERHDHHDREQGQAGHQFITHRAPETTTPVSIVRA